MPDIINAVFEIFGALFILLNVRRTMRDKQVRGIDWRYNVFFTAWGAWNLYYYQGLGQWWSWAAGVGVLLANAWWLVLIIYYGEMESRATRGIGVVFDEWEKDRNLSFRLDGNLAHFRWLGDNQMDMIDVIGKTCAFEEDQEIALQDPDDVMYHDLGSEGFMVTWTCKREF